MGSRAEWAVNGGVIGLWQARVRQKSSKERKAQWWTEEMRSTATAAVLWERLPFWLKSERFVSQQRKGSSGESLARQGNGIDVL